MEAVTMDALPKRIRTKIRLRENGCWQWVGMTNRGGYGSIRSPQGPMRMAHRVCYELLVGPIPEGLTLDHLCRNTACVNPAHLEAVSMRENILRSNSVGGINARKTHCPQGHLYSPDNTLTGTKGRYRRCRTCIREAWMRSERRQQRLQTSARRRAEQTTCKRGHPYPPEARLDPNKPRTCATCRKLGEKKWDAIKSAQRDALWRTSHGIAPEAPLSYRDKVLLGRSITAQHARITHCPKGHAYDDDNTYINRGKRHCRACHAESERRRKARPRGVCADG